MYPYFHFFLFSDGAQKYQHMPGFVTDDIFSYLLVINLKLSEEHFGNVT